MSASAAAQIGRTARALSRKNRSQVRVPKREIDVIQCTVSAVTASPGINGYTATVARAGGNPFLAAYSPHYTPASGHVCWVLMIGTSPLILARCQ